MRRLVSLAALTVLLLPVVGNWVLAQDSPAAHLLPDAADLGNGWSVLLEEREEAGAATSGTSWVSRDYVGPNGERVLVMVYLVAEGPKAARDAWELANSYFDAIRYSFDSAYGRERDLRDAPLVGGCADMRRVDGAEEIFPDIPVGLSLCAADPDVLVVAYVSGEVENSTGYAASDQVIELVLSRATRASATPASPRTPDAAPQSAALPNALATVTPTAEARSTAVPEPEEEEEAPSDAVEPTASAEPDRDISAETLPLLELLPTQEQVPAGLVLVDEAERSKAEVVAALGGTEEAAQLLDDWGWSGNAFRDFIADDTPTATKGVTFLNVSVHRYANAESAANAMIFHSDQLVFGQGLQEVEPPAVGENARLLRGAPDGVPLAVLYAQRGPIMYRIGGSTNSADGDPTVDVLMVAGEIISTPAMDESEPTHPPAAQATITVYATREALHHQQATATGAAQATPAVMSADERATEVAQATTAAIAAGATLSAYATRQATSDQSLDQLAREAARTAVAAAITAATATKSANDLSTAEAMIAAQDAEIAALEDQVGFAQGTVGPLVTAQAEAAARTTEVAVLQAQQVDAEVTATALAVVAANTVLDPTRQSITLQTDLDGMLRGDAQAVADARTSLTNLISRYPPGCRAGLMLMSGTAPSIEEGVDLAQRVESLLREGWPAIFTESTGAELFALPNQPPFGRVSIDIFFYAGCQPTR